MRTILFASALACCSLPVFANECELEFNGKMQLENGILVATLNNNTQLTIDKNKTLYIDGAVLALDSKQQTWVDNYYDGINQAVPQAAAIGKDAIALASSALNEVFTELLGSNNSALAELSDKLRSLDQQIQYNFYADNGDIRFHSESFQKDGLLDEQWSTQFEESIESLVSESIGQLMVSVGTQLIINGGDMDEFEQKMERFGEQMEQRVEHQATELEGKAKILCSTLTKIDVAETQLQTIDQLENLDVIQVQDQLNRM